MAAYKYRALDSDGKLIKGVLEGDSERQIRAQLRTKSLRPIEVTSAGRRAANGTRADPGAKRGWFAPRLSASELALVTRQLATLVASSLPLDECLQAAAEQTRRASTKALLLQVRSKVAEGHTLAHAMGQFPQTFGDMYRAMVTAGEQAGQLGPVLEQLADYTENRQHTAQKLQMALIYPFVLIGVAIAVVTALMVFVVPEMVGIFAQTKTELPPLTVALIATSDFLTNYGVLLMVGLVILVVVIQRLLKNPVYKKVSDATLLRVPGIRRVLIGMDTSRFSSTLSILMASGVPLLDALKIAGAVMNNLVLRASSQEVASKVQEGSSLNRALSQEDYFPPMMVHMVASGETSGELESMLERSASNQERELEATLGTVMALFEPIMVVFMGGLVLTIVMAILLPIFDLNTMVR
ncbi:type II secretion system inner membrane protein GspF [Luminiphilus sp.]|jgi:general secretion pathway protein F|nr:type II secretion system inner membrane protein GspF [Luminiphilus sp.]MDC0972790.1 type II secretion system inner membrane protein GspF [Luminiphilus sp.]